MFNKNTIKKPPYKKPSHIDQKYLQPDKVQDMNKTLELFNSLSTLVDYDSINKFIIDNNAILNAKDENDDSPLHHILRNTNISKNEKTKLCKFVLNRGAPPCIFNKDNVCPLHLASKEHLKEIVEELIKYTPDINVGDANEMSPLHYAVLPNSVNCNNFKNRKSLIPKVKNYKSFDESFKNIISNMDNLKIILPNTITGNQLINLPNPPVPVNYNNGLTNLQNDYINLIYSFLVNYNNYKINDIIGNFKTQQLTQDFYQLPDEKKQEQINNKKKELKANIKSELTLSFSNNKDNNLFNISKYENANPNYIRDPNFQKDYLLLPEKFNYEIIIDKKDEILNNNLPEKKENIKTSLDRFIENLDQIFNEISVINITDQQSNISNISQDYYNNINRILQHNGYPNNQQNQDNCNGLILSFKYIIKNLLKINQMKIDDNNFIYYDSRNQTLGNETFRQHGVINPAFLNNQYTIFIIIKHYIDKIKDYKDRLIGIFNQIDYNDPGIQINMYNNVYTDLLNIIVCIHELKKKYLLFFKILEYLQLNININRPLDKGPIQTDVNNNQNIEQTLIGLGDNLVTLENNQFFYQINIQNNPWYQNIEYIDNQRKTRNLILEYNKLFNDLLKEKTKILDKVENELYTQIYNIFEELNDIIEDNNKFQAYKLISDVKIFQQGTQVADRQAEGILTNQIQNQINKYKIYTFTNLPRTLEENVSNDEIIKNLEDINVKIYLNMNFMDNLGFQYQQNNNLSFTPRNCQDCILTKNDILGYYQQNIQPPNQNDQEYILDHQNVLYSICDEFIYFYRDIILRKSLRKLLYYLSFGIDNGQQNQQHKLVTELKKFHNENIANNEFIDNNDYNIVLSVFKDLFIKLFSKYIDSTLNITVDRIFRNNLSLNQARYTPPNFFTNLDEYPELSKNLQNDVDRRIYITFNQYSIIKDAIPGAPFNKKKDEQHKIINNESNNLICFDNIDKDVIDLLLRNGCDPNKKDNSENSPFIYAIDLQHDEIINSFINNEKTVYHMNNMNYMTGSRITPYEHSENKLNEIINFCEKQEIDHLNTELKEKIIKLTEYPKNLKRADYITKMTIYLLNHYFRELFESYFYVEKSENIDNSFLTDFKLDDQNLPLISNLNVKTAEELDDKIRERDEIQNKINLLGANLPTNNKYQNKILLQIQQLRDRLNSLPNVVNPNQPLQINLGNLRTSMNEEFFLKIYDDIYNRIKTRNRKISVNKYFQLWINLFNNHNYTKDSTQILNHILEKIKKKENINHTQIIWNNIIYKNIDNYFNLPQFYEEQINYFLKNIIDIYSHVIKHTICMNLNSVFIKLVMDHLKEKKMNDNGILNFIRRSETIGYLTDIVPTKIVRSVLGIKQHDSEELESVINILENSINYLLNDKIGINNDDKIIKNLKEHIFPYFEKYFNLYIKENNDYVNKYLKSLLSLSNNINIFNKIKQKQLEEYQHINN